MKDRNLMEKFEDLFDRHRGAATGIICAVALLVVAVCVLSIVRNTGEKPKKKANAPAVVTFYEDGAYPVSAHNEKNGELVVKLSDSETPHLLWKYKAKEKKAVSVFGDQEKGGGFSSRIKPLKQGTATVFYSKNMKLAAMKHRIVEVVLKVYVSENEKGELIVNVQSVDESVSNQIGAADTETPYLIEDGRILFPGGGDWELSYKNEEEGAKSGFTIMPSYTDEGYMEDMVFYYKPQPGKDKKRKKGKMEDAVEPESEEPLGEAVASEAGEPLGKAVERKMDKPLGEAVEPEAEKPQGEMVEPEVEKPKPRTELVLASKKLGIEDTILATGFKRGEVLLEKAPE